MYLLAEREISTAIHNRDMNTNSSAQVSPGTITVSEDAPLSFSTVQLYVPTMSLQPTDESMVSTVW